MKSLIIANWKMNFSINESTKWLDYFVTNTYLNANVIIAPPTPLICYLKFKYAKYANLDFCLQDISIFNNFGAYTGECSAKIAHNSGINYAIIGHSERRKYSKETNQVVKIKIENCIMNDICPIICIGESDEDRKNNMTEKRIIEQIKESIQETDKFMVIAYEPIWSIGTGIIPTTVQIRSVIDLIRNTICKTMKNIKIIYGGSIDSKNYQCIISDTGVDGLLIGSTSLNVRDFVSIVKGV